MATKQSIVIDLGKRRIRALLASWHGRSLHIDRGLVALIPSELDGDDVEAMGQWLRDTLKEHSFPRGKATFVLSRHQVALKRLRLPSVDEHELPDMARLAMQRDLPFDAASAVIDFAPVKQEDGATIVMAVAAADDAMVRMQAIAKAAGLGIERVALRGMGAPALIQSLETNGSATLVIDVIGEGVEFNVVHESAVRHSRAAELPAGDNASAQVAAVLTEARRTWMSYRMIDGAPDVKRALLMGDRSVTEKLEEPIAEMLRVPTEVLNAHPMVHVAAADDVVPAVWPLVGLLVETHLGGEMIDFAHPRKAPDFQAIRRRRLLLVAGFLLIVLFGGWTTAQRFLGDLDTEISGLKSKLNDGSNDFYRAGREQVRLLHLDKWESVGVDWIEHLTYLQELAPDPNTLVLDSWGGRLDFRGVRYDKKAPSGSRFSAPLGIRITVEGEAADRIGADAFRESLVEIAPYQTASVGPDRAGGKRHPFGFTYALTMANRTSPFAETDRDADSDDEDVSTEATP